jgi:uncharacterized protein (TIGR02145 family)
MEKAKNFFTISSLIFFLFSLANLSAGSDRTADESSRQTNSKSAPQTKTTTTQTTSKSAQTKTTSTQTVSKSAQTKTTTKQSSKSAPAKPKTDQKSTKPEPEKTKDASTLKIGTQSWAAANLNVVTFRNGDTIPEAKTNKDWVKAGESGKPAWCYYNNDPSIGQLYGRLYNWYAVNDPRGLAPDGWKLPSDTDWEVLASYLGGSGAAGIKMKSSARWNEGNNGTNDSGFTGFPEGYRHENGAFVNIGSIGIWWSSKEYNPPSAVDFYLSLSSSFSRSSSPKQRGESVRCLRN